MLGAERPGVKPRLRKVSQITGIGGGREAQLQPKMSVRPVFNKTTKTALKTGASADETGGAPPALKGGKHGPKKPKPGGPRRAGGGPHEPGSRRPAGGRGVSEKRPRLKPSARHESGESSGSDCSDGRGHQPRVCYTCGKKGHVARDCLFEDEDRPRRGGRSSGRSPYEGMRAGEAADLADDAAGRGPALDDDRPDVAEPAAPPVKPEKPAETAEEKAARYRRNLVSKAQTMLWTKDVTSVADLNVVRRAMVAILRADNMHESFPNVVELGSEVLLQAVDDVCRIRIREERARLELPVYMSHLRTWEDLYVDRYFTTLPLFLAKLQKMPSGSVSAPPMKLAPSRDGVCSILFWALMQEVFRFFLVVPAVLVTTFAMHLAGRVPQRMLYGVFNLPGGAINPQPTYVAATAYVYWALALYFVHWLAKRETERHQPFGTKTVFYAKLALHTLLHLFAVLCYEPYNTGVSYEDPIGPWLLPTAVHFIINLCLSRTSWRYWQLNPALHVADWDRMIPGAPGNVLQDTCISDHPAKLAKVQAGASVVWGEAKCLPSYGLRWFWRVAGTTGTIFRKCTCNEKFSMCGRVLKHLPQHESVAVATSVKARWRKAIPTIDWLSAQVAPVTRPITYVDWCAVFPPKKREMFLKMRDDDELHVQKGWVSGAFIKREIAMKCDAAPVFKDPRWIQPCPTALSGICGPWVRKLSKNLKNGLWRGNTVANVRAGHQVFYTCGSNSEEIGRIYYEALQTIESMCLGSERVVVIEDDQSRFDLHMTEGPMFGSKRFLTRLLPYRIRKHLIRTPKTKGRGATGTKYTVPYTMQSGMIDTAFTDTQTNAVMKFEIHGIGARWISIICGDDSVTVTVDSEIEKLGGVKGIEEKYAEFGMEVEVVLRTDCRLAEFCSGRFFFHNDTATLVPKIGKALSRLGHDMVDRKPAQQQMWLRSIAETLGQFGKLDPVACAFGKRLTELCGEGPKLVLPDNEYKIRYTGNGVYSRDEILDYYDLHYQMSEADVDQMIRTASSFNLGDVITDPMFVAAAFNDL